MIDQKTLRAYLTYDAGTGEFCYARTTRGHRRGAPAGHIDSAGYIGIGVAGGRYRAHRLAWLYAHGSWPQGQLDHLNGDKSDNRIANLRDVSHGTNQQNRRGINKNNTSGFPGVRPRKHYFVARLTLNGKSKHLGYFPTPEAAHQAYLIAKRQHHQGCTI